MAQNNFFFSMKSAVEGFILRYKAKRWKKSKNMKCSHSVWCYCGKISPFFPFLFFSFRRAGVNPNFQRYEKKVTHTQIKRHAVFFNISLWCSWKKGYKSKIKKVSVWFHPICSSAPSTIKPKRAKTKTEHFHSSMFVVFNKNEGH